MKVKIHTYFDPPPSPGLDCKDASLTRQEFVQESDINNIMKRYAAGMPIPSGSRKPMYGDYTEVPDYAGAFEIVQHAQESFDALSSDVRARFDNDPGQLIAFLADEKNREEGIKLGLLNKSVENTQTVEKSVSVPEKIEGEVK